jgi:hypothetical protein
MLLIVEDSLCDPLNTSTKQVDSMTPSGVCLAAKGLEGYAVLSRLCERVLQDLLIHLLPVQTPSVSPVW